MLSDVKCSREHAVIRITQNSASVEDLGSQNGIIVDGEKTTRSFLRNGSKIQIGTTVLAFKRIQSIQTTVYKDSFSSKSSSGDQSKKLRFYIIVASVIILGIWLSTSENSSLTPEPKLSIDQETEASIKRQEELIKRQAEDGLASRQYLDAQASFMKGLRDYREAHYKSAYISFNAALSIYPNHKLARRYLRLAQNKLDEQIQALINEGNKAMEENKYQMAQSAFKNAMILIGDPESKIYKEAKEKLNECNLLLRESF